MKCETWIKARVEYETWRKLNDNSDIIILKVDKGDTILIMKKVDYVINMYELLDTSGFYVEI